MGSSSRRRGALGVIILLAALLATALAATSGRVWAAGGGAGSGPAASPPAAQRSITRVVGNVVVPAGTVVRGDVAVAFGNVDVEGEVTGSVAVGVGNIHVGGRVDGDVRIGAGSLSFGPHGSVGGATAVGMASATVSRRVVLPGDVAVPLALAGATLGGAWQLLLGPVFHILRWLGALAIALPIAALFPQAVAAIRDQAEAEPVRAGLIGLLAGLLALPALVLMAITIVGIPVALVSVVVLIAAGFFGYVAVCAWVGGALLRAAGRAEVAPLWPVVAGSAAIALAEFVPLLGALVTLAVVAIGAGAILLWRFRGLRGPLGKAG